jgi:hypothetical protein
MQVTYELTDEEVFECFIEILSQSDEHLKRTLSEYISKTSQIIHTTRGIDVSKIPPVNKDIEKIFRSEDNRMTTALARITLLLENL